MPACTDPLTTLPLPDLYYDFLLMILHFLSFFFKYRQHIHKCQCLSRVQLFANPMDCSPPGSSVHGILQARILEWVSMPSSRGPSRPRGQTRVFPHFRQIIYHVRHQGSPKNTRLGCQSLGDLSNSGIEPGSPALQVASLPTEPLCIFLQIEEKWVETIASLQGL